MSIAAFVSPVDWQEVGRCHCIRFTWPGHGELPHVELFDKAEFVAWMQSEPRGALPAARTIVRARRLPHGECVAEPQVELPLGDGILALRAPGSGAVAAAIGIRVMAGADDWATAFPRLLVARLALLPARRLPPPGRDGQPTFSITTTVYDTEPRFLDELFACLQGQRWSDFEWLVLDNGSTRADVQQLLRDHAARDARVRHFRVDQNIHIIPGNRYLLERARGRYVVPVDSDDLVYADALAIFAERLASDSPPAILFSEETKVTQDGVAAEYIWRPEYSRLAALATCPASHLMAFDRERALAVDVYRDDYARGSHDWDTFLRIALAGGRAVRVPAVLYGWRMHPASASVNVGSKDYLLASQRGVLEHALSRLGLQERFAVEATEPGGLGYFHLARLPVAPRLLAVDFVVRRGGDDELRALRHNLAALDYPGLQVRVLYPAALAMETRERVHRLASAQGHVVADYGAEGPGVAVSALPPGAALKIAIDAGMQLQRADWPWECLGAFELDPDLGVLGGRVLDRDGRIQHLGYFAGLDGFVATPGHGQLPGSVYGQRAYFRRHATAVHGGLIAVRADVFARVGPLLDVDSDDGLFGVEFCTRCAAAGLGVAFTPRWSAVRERPLANPVGQGHPLKELLSQQQPRLSTTDPYYSSLLCQTSAQFGVGGHHQSAPIGTATPLLHQVVRGAAIAAHSARQRTRAVVRRALDFLRGGPPWRNAVGRLEPAPEPAGTASTAVRDRTWVPPTGLCTPADPLHFVVDAALADGPRLNVLLPVVGMKSMSGGPNTVLNLAYRMAAAGVAVRFLSTSGPLDADLEPIWAHLQRLSGVPRRLPGVEFVDAHDRRRPIAIGSEDTFMASAWWTAQMVKYALPLVRAQTFLYVIQDFEPVLHEHGSLHALALETYELDCVPIVNHPLLRDYLRLHAIGRFRDPAFAARSIVVDPAIDRSRFNPDERRAGASRRLLFYARPNSARRNLFELGVAALQRAVALGAFDAEPWQLLAMGDPVPEIGLGRGHSLRPAPWLDFDGYAAQMRQADLLLAPMLSPHPSYPPLEMAACGGLVVTTAYDCKTNERMQDLSANITAAPATIEGMSDALVVAAARVGDAAARRRGAALRAPASWDESFALVVPAVLAALAQCRRSP